MKKNFKQILFYVILIVAVILVCAALFRQTTDAAEMKYSDVVSAFKQEQVASFEIDKNNVLTLTFGKDSELAEKFNTYKDKDGN